MNLKFLNLKTLLFLAFMLGTTGLWAMDADDEDDAAEDAPAATQDADAKPDVAAKPDQAAAPPGHTYAVTAAIRAPCRRE